MSRSSLECGILSFGNQIEEVGEVGGVDDPTEESAMLAQEIYFSESWHAHFTIARNAVSVIPRTCVTFIRRKVKEPAILIIPWASFGWYSPRA